MTSREDQSEIPDPGDSPVRETTSAGSENLDRADGREPSPDDIERRALASGVHVADLEIVEPLREGDFGIVYVARRNDGVVVALAEYMPRTLAARVDTTQVDVASESDREAFRAGLEAFIGEARLLARLHHESLTRVDSILKENGTAYVVMPYYKEAVTLDDQLRQMPEAPSENWLRYDLISPLINALSVLHAAGGYHGGIATNKVMFVHGRPLLLHAFGAAGRAIVEMRPELMLPHEPGYAPVEEYGQRPSRELGRWSDIYSLAAVFYNAIQGTPPPPADVRMRNDTYEPLARGQLIRHYPAPFLHAIDHALALSPMDRPRTVQELAAELGVGDEAWNYASGSAPSGVSPATEAKASRGMPRTGLRAGLWVALAVILAIWFFTQSKPSVVRPTLELHGEPGQSTGTMPAPPKPEND